MISRCQNLSRTTVSDYLSRAAKADLGWPLPKELTDQELERSLFPPIVPISPDRLIPNWPEVHNELKRKGVTLTLLREE